MNKTKDDNLHVRIESDLKKKLIKKAEDDNTKVSMIIIMLLKRYLK